MNPRDQSTVAAISGGSREAFVSLFDLTSGAIRAELALHLSDVDQAVHVFASTYVEVWWLAGCWSGPEVDAVEWIRQILHRRIAVVYTASQLSLTPPPAPHRIVIPRTSSAESELAALLGRPVRRLRPN
jgi:hypothetical protein